jgi:hypothetical protein
MTIEKLLENLRSQLNSINGAIHAIEQVMHNEHHSVKRARIISSIKKERRIHRKKNYDSKRGIPVAPKSYNGKHWMQNPKNRARVLKMVAKMKRANRRRNGK